MTRILLSIILLCLAACSDCYAGYTIIIRDQISPKTIMVQGVGKLESALNPGPVPVYPATAKQLLYKPVDADLYSTDPIKRTELWDDDNGTATDAAVLAACPGLKNKIVAEIKEVRAIALEKTTKNSGVSAIYDENYQASVAYDAGQGDLTEMRNGMTATQYLTGFGARLGMTAAQFAAYIIAENKRVGPTAYQVEDEYLRLAYGVIPNETSVASLMAYPTAYRTFCGL